MSRLYKHITTAQEFTATSVWHVRLDCDTAHVIAQKGAEVLAFAGSVEAMPGSEVWAYPGSNVVRHKGATVHEMGGSVTPFPDCSAS